MARAPQQPIEIVVTASLVEPHATIRWTFVRLQVTHRFEMYVVQDERDKTLAIRDNQFQMSYPISLKQRDEWRRKHPRSVEVPTETGKKISVTNVQYKDMIASLRRLLIDKPLIEDARTSRMGMVSVRYPEFVYPSWYRKREPTSYDPRELRRVDPENVIIMPNGSAVPAPTSLATIVAQYTPPPTRTYEQGVGDAVQTLQSMAEELTSVANQQTTPAGQAIFNGYVAMLGEAQKRVVKLTT
jgi:hypothetical protein